MSSSSTGWAGFQPHLSHHHVASRYRTSGFPILLHHMRLTQRVTAPAGWDSLCLDVLTPPTPPSSHRLPQLLVRQRSLICWDKIQVS